MEKFIFLRKNQANGLPKTAGVYSFSSGKELLYVGKARSIRERVKNHFQQPNFRDNLFLEKVKKVSFIETNSEIEALLLEAQLIKKYQPKFNIIWRDDKNYFYVIITPSFARSSAGKKEKLPRVLITHQPHKSANLIGPFVDGNALKKTLRLLRRTFPFYTTKKHSHTPCSWCHLNLCPGPNPDIKKYKKDIKNLIAVLEGKKQRVLKNLKKEMLFLSGLKDFERAAKIRDQIFALEKTISNARIFEPSISQEINWQKTEKILQGLLKTKGGITRIEGYDVSNIQGKEATASMVVFVDGKPEKNLYRKFRIKISGKPDDVAMIKEVLNRRMSHNEWPRPDLILMDGGKPQLNAALSVVGSKILVVALAKRKNELYIGGNPPSHKASDGQGKNPILLKSLPREIFNLILQIRDESHRFAIAYHKQLRKTNLLG